LILVTAWQPGERRQEIFFAVGRPSHSAQVVGGDAVIVGEVMLRSFWAVAGCVLGVGLAAPDAAGQVTYTWGTAANGNYNAAGNWSPAGVPTAIDNVLINATGSAYTVTLNDNRSITDFTLNSANATFAHTGGNYNLDGTMTLTSGVYSLNGGTIAGGTVTGAAGRLRIGTASSTLSNVQIGASVLDLSTASARLSLIGNSNFSAPSTYTTGTGFGLTVSQAAAVNNLDLTLGGSSSITTGSIGFTLGSSSALRLSGSSAADLFIGSGNTFTNQGLVVNAGTAAWRFNFSAFTGAVVNSGIIRNSGSGSTTFTTESFANQAGGTLDAQSGTVSINSLSWSNAGTIKLGTGAVVNLGGSVSAFDLGTFDRGGSGTPGTNGTLNLTGTLTLDTNLDLHTVTGTLVGQAGTINGAGGVLSSSGASRFLATTATSTLNNVSIVPNTLDLLSTTNGRLTLTGGSNFTAASSHTTATGFVLTVSQAAAVNNLTLTLGDTAALTAGASGLTVGGTSVVRLSGANNGSINSTGGGAVGNAGVIRNSGTGTLTINPNSFANLAGGLVDAQNGTVTLAATSWTNAGTIRLAAGSTVNMGSSFSSATLGTIDRGGSGVPGTNGALNLTGTMTLAGNLDLHTATGTLIGAGGTVTGGGFILSSSGTSRYVAGTTNSTLSNVLVALNTLDLSTNSGRFTLAGGSNFTAATALTTGTGFTFTVDQTAAVNNLTLTLGNTGVAQSGANGFTLGSTSTVRVTGTNTASITTTSAASLTNQGLILNSGSGGLNIGGIGTVTNTGTIRNSNTGTLTINPNSFANLAGGLVDAQNGTVTLAATSWTNAGTIRLAAGSTVNLGGVYTSAALGTIDRGGGGVPGTNGTLNLTGTMTLSGNLDLHTATGTLVGAGVTVTGGGFTLSSSGGSRYRAGTTNSTLSNVLLAAGVLDLSTASGRLALTGGTNFAAGSAYTTGGSFWLSVNQAAAVNNLDLTLGNSSFTDTGAAGFTLGVTSVVRLTGSDSGFIHAFNASTSAASSVTNQGLLINSGTGTLTIGSSAIGTVTNAGLIHAQTGTVTLNPNTWSNAAGTIRLGSSGTVNLGGTFSSANLGAFDRGGSGVPGTNGTLRLTGTLNLASNLDLHTTTGTLNGGGGTINGGGFTLSSSGGSRYLASSGTLSNVQLAAGLLDLSANTGRLTVTGNSNFAAGSVYTTGSSFGLTVNQAAAVNNLDLTLGDNAATDTAAAGFTLGGTSAVRYAGAANAYVYSFNVFAGSGASTLTNQGLIVNAGVGTLTVGGGSGTVTNAGLIHAQTGTVTLNPNTWSNAAGTIRLGSSGTVNLGGTFSSANLGAFDRGGSGVPGTNGTLLLSGTMSLSGNLDLHTATGTLRGNGGTVAGGGFTLSSSGVSRFAPTTSSSTLSNVLVAANTLDLSAAGGRLTVTGNSNFAAGSVHTTGGSFGLRVDQAAAVNNLDLTLGDNSYVDTAAAGFTLGGTSAVRYAGTANAYVYSYNATGGGASTLTNQGLIVNSGAGTLTVGGGAGTVANAGTIRNTSTGTITINPATLTVTPTGVVEATNGTLTVPDATSFTNLTSGTLTNGTYRATNATMNWGTRTVSTIAANTAVELRGVGAFAAVNPLQTVNGSFLVGDGRAFTVANPANSFTNAGTITVTGSGASLTIPTAVNLTNYNPGTQTLTGGTFRVLNGGALNLGTRTTPVIAAGTTVELSGSTASFSAVEGGVLTTVSGTLLVGGGKSLAVAPGGLTITSGGLLGGHLGTIAGKVTVLSGGVISPGNSPGQITLSGGLDLGGTFNVDISPGVGGGNNSNTVGDTTPGSGFDTIIVTAPPSPANVTVRPSAKVRVSAADTALASSSFWAALQRWAIVRTTDGLILGDDGLPLAPGTPASTTLVNRDTGSPVDFAAYGSFAYSVVVLGDTGAGQRQLDLVWTPVPEPTTVLAVAVAPLAAGWAARRLRRGRRPADTPTVIAA
jgi:fibronectin-binding autotransporter adhesin